jgi:hypothetical protein
MEKKNSYSVYGIITLIIFVLLIVLYYYYYERPTMLKDISYTEKSMIKKDKDSHDIYVTLSHKEDKISLENNQALLIYGIIPRNCVYFSIDAYDEKNVVLNNFSSSMIDNNNKDEIELALILTRNSRLTKEIEYHFIKETRRLKKMERRVKFVYFPIPDNCKDITWKYKIILNDKDEKIPLMKYRIYEKEKIKYRPYKVEKKEKKIKEEIKRNEEFASIPLYISQENSDYLKIHTNEMKIDKRALVKIFAVDHAINQTSIFSSLFIHKGDKILSYVTGNYKSNSGAKKFIVNEFSFIAENGENIYIEENIFYHPNEKIVDTDSIIPFYMTIDTM